MIDSEGRDGSGDVKVLVSLHMFILRTAGLVEGLRSIPLARVLSEDLTPNPSPFVSAWQARFISRPLNWVHLSPPERFTIVFFCLGAFLFYNLKITLSLRLSKHRNHNWVMGLNTYWCICLFLNENSVVIYSPSWHAKLLLLFWHLKLLLVFKLQKEWKKLDTIKHSSYDLYTIFRDFWSYMIALCGEHSEIRLSI